MPHLRLRAVQPEHVELLSNTLPAALAPLMETSADNFSFELIGTQYFENGKASSSYPFIEVFWFARTQDVQDRSAIVITDMVKKLMPSLDVVVVFQEYKKSAYYENGSHF